MLTVVTTNCETQSQFNNRSIFKLCPDEFSALKKEHFLYKHEKMELDVNILITFYTIEYWRKFECSKEFSEQFFILATYPKRGYFKIKNIPKGEQLEVCSMSSKDEYVLLYEKGCGPMTYKTSYLASCLKFKRTAHM